MGSLVRRLREERFLNQEELADKAGVSVWTISRIETNQAKNPRLTTIRQLAQALGVPPQDLKAGDGRVN